MNDTNLIANATSVISDILKAVANNGIGGIVGLLWAYDKWIVPRLKKNKEEWVSWRDVKAMKETIAKLDSILTHHIEQAQGENVKIAIMENTIANQGKAQEEMKGDIKDVFRIVSEIKNFLIEGKAR